MTRVTKRVRSILFITVCKFIFYDVSVTTWKTLLFQSKVDYRIVKFGYFYRCVAGKYTHLKNKETKTYVSYLNLSHGIYLREG